MSQSRIAAIVTACLLVWLVPVLLLARLAFAPPVHAVTVAPASAPHMAAMGPVVPAKGISCSVSTYADAGAGTTAIQVALADAGTPNFGCNLKALSTNTASVFVGCSADITATSGIHQGRELQAAETTWTPSNCVPYVVSTAASQGLTCECFGN